MRNGKEVNNLVLRLFLPHGNTFSLLFFLGLGGRGGVFFLFPQHRSPMPFVFSCVVSFVFSGFVS